MDLSVKHMQHSMLTAQVTTILEKDNTLCVLKEKNVEETKKQFGLPELTPNAAK